jgi:hypothetical protein
MLKPFLPGNDKQHWLWLILLPTNWNQLSPNLILANTVGISWPVLERTSQHPPVHSFKCILVLNILLINSLESLMCCLNHVLRFHGTTNIQHTYGFLKKIINILCRLLQYKYTCTCISETYGNMVVILKKWWRKLVEMACEYTRYHRIGLP